MTFLDAAAVRILETNDPFGILQTLCSSTVCWCPASLALSQCLTMWKNVNFCPVIVSFTSSLPIYHGKFQLVMIRTLRRTVIEKKFRGKKKNQKSFYFQHPSTKETAHLSKGENEEKLFSGRNLVQELKFSSQCHTVIVCSKVMDSCSRHSANPHSYSRKQANQIIGRFLVLPKLYLLMQYCQCIFIYFLGKNSQLFSRRLGF